jgi:hypothetical protein
MAGFPNMQHPRLTGDRDIQAWVVFSRIVFGAHEYASDAHHVTREERRWQNEQGQHGQKEYEQHRSHTLPSPNVFFFIAHLKDKP